MNANPVLLQKKYARIVERYAQRYQMPVEKALELFYDSELYQLISNGVSDLHCMSDEYLVEELHDEWSGKSGFDSRCLDDFL